MDEPGSAWIYQGLAKEGAGPMGGRNQWRFQLPHQSGEGNQLSRNKHGISDLSLVELNKEVSIISVLYSLQILCRQISSPVDIEHSLFFILFVLPTWYKSDVLSRGSCMIKGCNVNDDGYENLLMCLYDRSLGNYRFMDCCMAWCNHETKPLMQAFMQSVFY